MSKPAPGPGPIRVLCVEDHAVVREGLALIINNPADLQVVGAAATGEEGVAPGQACALYDPADPDRLLGGGFIKTTEPVVA